jgi:signal peptidase I
LRFSGFPRHTNNRITLVDFSLILFIFLVVTGLISLGYRLMFEGRAGSVGDSVVTESAGDDGGARQPVLVEYARALFPVILIVFVLRSFIVEPFRIPSGSMLPGLQNGDFILVNKFGYGIRLPVINRKILDIGEPERGDVMVFRFPRDPSLNFIKRVIGLPGDTLTYVDKQLSINGEPVPAEPAGEHAFQQVNMRGYSARRLKETIDESEHFILIDDRAGRSRNMEVVVPEGHYFVMGDNRDHSNDSRYWRFVPEENVVGEAFFIWFSWKSESGGGVDWGRIGNSID